jgi:ribosome-associated protein
VVIINIKKLSTVSDYIVICSAGSERQISAIAGAITEGLKEKDERPFGLEGVGTGRWALLDYSDVVAHIFLAPARAFYDLEGLWADAPLIKVDARPARAAKPARAARRPVAKAAKTRAK